MSKDLVLKLDHICKNFPGVKALDDVSVEVTRGTVHALCGENGAGKSTLIKILAGIYHHDSGTVFLDGKEVNFKAPSEALEHGISVIHQEIKLVPTLTVAENIFLGNQPVLKNGAVDWKTMNVKAQQMINELGVDIRYDTLVSDLTISKQQIVEVCKSINRDAQIIIMDEPSATLTNREVEILFNTIHKLKAKGYTVIYISHRMEEVFHLADNITVLRDGKSVKTMAAQDTNRNDLINLMVGREMGDQYPEKTAKLSDEVVLEVKNLNEEGVLHNISFNLRKGEILGFSGLVGAGRTELARAILGIDKKNSGEITYKGSKANWNKFIRAINDGMGLVPEDRKGQGLVLIQSVKNNVCLAALDKTIKGGFIRPSLEKKYSSEYVKSLNIITPSIEQEVQYLSGGNQQKVVVGKWLMRDSEILILDEPTRGIDVGAKQEMYVLIDKLAAEGKSIIMISSEMPELIGMCDRILVMSGGEIKGEFNRGEATQEKIMELCV